MRRYTCLILFSFATIFLNAQSNTLFLKPDSSAGKDAIVFSLDNLNRGRYTSFISAAWTWNGNPGVIRSLIRFDLSSIQPGAVINSAYLTLFNDSVSPMNLGNHYGLNTTYLRRIISPWIENTVNWSNQPLTTTQNEVALPQSQTQNENYYNIDVTSLINDILSSGNNFGFMLELQTEQLYRTMVFASSDHPDKSLRPELKVNYDLPTSIKELTPLWGVAPNPVSDYFEITTDGNSQVVTSIEVLDGAGKILLTKSFSTSESKRLDISTLSSGIYFIRIYSENGVHIEKVVRS